MSKKEKKSRQLMHDNGATASAQEISTETK
jgi:hypothetical protein